MTPINLAITEDFIAAVSEVVYARLSERLPQSTASPWMNARQAADYLGCGVGRIHDLTHVGQIPFHKDGRRLMFHRDELDAWIRRGGGKRP
jgi:excisionase family DNA binding protein